MPLSLREYAEWLDERQLLWPAVPSVQSAKANPYLEPLPEIRAVTWTIYGTLLSISDGELLLEHPQQIRMQVALEKTIHEFNMWQSMTRRPGAPWEYMLGKYQEAVAELKMAPSPRKGDLVEVNSAQVWRKLIRLLEQKDYDYDQSFYGTPEQLSEKVAFFFHRCLQGTRAAPGAGEALAAVADLGLQQGLLSNAQPFTLAQMLRALEKQATLPPLNQLFAPGCLILSFQEGVRKPSLSLYQRCLQQFQKLGIEPSQILHVGTRIQDDLAVAKRLGFRTALYAGDKSSLRATAAEVKDSLLQPDRLLTELGQIRQIVGGSR